MRRITRKGRGAAALAPDRRRVWVTRPTKEIAYILRQRLNARDESGFTLIEFLVLIIIGVLLAIAIPSYLGFQKKAQQTAAMSDVRSAIPDAEAYYSDNNGYTGMSASALQSMYDSGLVISSSGRPAS